MPHRCASLGDDGEVSSNGSGYSLGVLALGAIKRRLALMPRRNNGALCLGLLAQPGTHVQVGLEFWPYRPR